MQALPFHNYFGFSYHPLVSAAPDANLPVQISSRSEDKNVLKWSIFR